MIRFGADAVFIFTNAYCIAEAERPRGAPPAGHDAHARARPAVRTSAAPRAERDEGEGCCGSVGDGEVLWRTLREAGAITSCAMTTTAVAFGASIGSPISTEDSGCGRCSTSASVGDTRNRGTRSPRSRPTNSTSRLPTRSNS